MTERQETFGQRLRYLRVHVWQMSQREFAEQAGVDLYGVGKVELGLRPPYALDTIERVAIALAPAIDDITALQQELVELADAYTPAPIDPTPHVVFECGPNGGRAMERSVVPPCIVCGQSAIAVADKAYLCSDHTTAGSAP